MDLSCVNTKIRKNRNEIENSDNVKKCSQSKGATCSNHKVSKRYSIYLNDERNIPESIVEKLKLLEDTINQEIRNDEGVRNHLEHLFPINLKISDNGVMKLCPTKRIYSKESNKMETNKSIVENKRPSFFEIFYHSEENVNSVVENDVYVRYSVGQITVKDKNKETSLNNLQCRELEVIREENFEGDEEILLNDLQIREIEEVQKDLKTVESKENEISINDLQFIEIEEMEKNFQTEKNEEILNKDLQFIRVEKNLETVDSKENEFSINDLQLREIGENFSSEDESSTTNLGNITMISNLNKKVFNIPINNISTVEITIKTKYKNKK
ncbi:uncharacterized protein LOC127278922 [Leptopilina boulardi]|uniref:uncharacterized protein LOC127278922 n=1 Tax=Leptopilina boulardi TaxID=63433 RepID=UPI0021F53FA8|nr:uncharacterized protein LOC127278922 [Leptopilina boulardi]